MQGFLIMNASRDIVVFFARVDWTVTHSRGKNDAELVMNAIKVIAIFYTRFPYN